MVQAKTMKYFLEIKRCGISYDFCVALLGTSPLPHAVFCFSLKGPHAHISFAEDDSSQSRNVLNYAVKLKLIFNWTVKLFFFNHIIMGFNWIVENFLHNWIVKPQYVFSHRRLHSTIFVLSF